MKKLSISILFLVLLIAVPVTVFADLKVIVAKESDLPFELSPSKFSNSPSKFSNSVSKFSNSLSEFSNSPSKFDNSPSKFDNGKSGNRRLLLEQEGSYFYIGYYVWGEDGLINFFPPMGKDCFTLLQKRMLCLGVRMESSAGHWQLSRMRKYWS